MKKETRYKFPLFTDTKKYDTIMITNDFDSLLSGKLLEQQSDCQISYFFDNQFVYNIPPVPHDKINKLVGVDVDLINGRCWGNHVTLISKYDEVNKKSANLNNIYKINARDNYYKKYAGSTAIQILSYYNYKLDDLSDEAKKVILCIDSHFTGLKNDNYKAVQAEWLKVLDYEELIDLANNTPTEQFYQLQDKYNLKSKIYIDDEGYLYTNIKLNELSELFEMDLLLPTEKFIKKDMEFDTAIQYIKNKNKKNELTNNKMFIYVQTYQKSGLFNFYKN